MKCADCKHWFDKGPDYSSCDRDALLRERDFFCAAWESKHKINWKPKTNADRIRSMTDEELREFIGQHDCLDCPLNSEETWCDRRPGETCHSALLRWLKEEVSDERQTMADESQGH